MAPGPEKKVKDKIRQTLQEFGAYSFMPVSSGHGTHGIGDVVACYKGFFISIEAKATPQQKPSQLQILNAHKVTAAGGCVLLIHCDNIEVVRDTLVSVDNGVRPPYVWPNLLDEVV